MMPMIRAELSRLIHTGFTYVAIALATIPNILIAFLIAWSHDQSNHPLPPGGFMEHLGSCFAMPGIICVLTSLFAVVYFSAERKEGFLKSLLTLPQGRLSYGFAQVAVTALMALLLIICDVVSAALLSSALGLNGSGYDIGAVLALCLQVLAVSVAIATVCLMVLDITRSMAIALMAAFLFSTGTFRLFLSAMLQAVPQANTVPDALNLLPSGIMYAINKGSLAAPTDFWLTASLFVVALGALLLALHRQAIR